MKLTSLLAALAVACSSSAAQAQGYPSRPITMIVPFPAGGPTDTLGRIISEGMRPSLGQTIVIENVTGAGGRLSASVAPLKRRPTATRSASAIGRATWCAGALYPIQYDLVRDFEPVSLLTFAPMLIVAKNEMPAKNARSSLLGSRPIPTRHRQPLSAPAAPRMCAGLYFQDKTGTRFQFVPYRGAAPAMQDLVGGQIDLMCAEASQTLTYVRSGKLKAFAVMAKTRWPALPDVPTTDEIGAPGMHISFWHGLWVPKGTPRR